mmetsp:Transcript_102119/g.218667  ORF Transcript_102119/g.218667 Transcript_102119/m.218667 type:complete len:174 (+) Transcript_102119:98-619(+)
MEGAYAKALAILCAGLGLKLAVITLMTIRCRIVSSQFRPIKEDHESKVVAFLLNYPFKAMLLIFPLGPSATPAGTAPLVGTPAEDEALTTWLNVHRNSAEQEPYMLAVAFAYPLVIAVPSALAVNLLYTYLCMRIAYMLAYALRLQPWRSLLWFTGFLCILTLSILTMMAAFA